MYLLGMSTCQRHTTHIPWTEIKTTTTFFVAMKHQVVLIREPWMVRLDGVVCRQARTCVELCALFVKPVGCGRGSAYSRNLTIPVTHCTAYKAGRYSIGARLVFATDFSVFFLAFFSSFSSFFNAFSCFFSSLATFLSDPKSSVSLWAEPASASIAWARFAVLPTELPSTLVLSTACSTLDVQSALMLLSIVSNVHVRLWYSRRGSVSTTSLRSITDDLSPSLRRYVTHTVTDGTFKQIYVRCLADRRFMAATWAACVCCCFEVALDRSTSLRIEFRRRISGDGFVCAAASTMSKMSLSGSPPSDVSDDCARDDIDIDALGPVLLAPVAAGTWSESARRWVGRCGFGQSGPPGPASRDIASKCRDVMDPDKAPLGPRPAGAVPPVSVFMSMFPDALRRCSTCRRRSRRSLPRRPFATASRASEASVLVTVVWRRRVAATGAVLDVEGTIDGAGLHDTVALSPRWRRGGGTGASLSDMLSQLDDGNTDGIPSSSSSVPTPFSSITDDADRDGGIPMVGKAAPPVLPV
eukprot:m.1630928 g.1630928  ORF g.1630928 m.1630928 type:complete len:526 (+) comp25400_c0_seq3:968-2545(+)